MIVWSREDLKALTDYKQKGKIALWLRENGFAFYLGRDGWPRVLRNTGTLAPKSLTKSEPDFTTLKERQHGTTKKKT